MYFEERESLGTRTARFLKKGATVVGSFLFIGIFAFILMSLISKIAAMNHENSASLLVVISTVSLIGAAVAFLVFILDIFICFKYINFSKEIKIVSMYGNETSRREKKSGMVIFTFAAIILGSVFLFLYFANSYTTIYKDKIRKHEMLASMEKTYTYEDIEKATIRVKNIKRNGADLEYKVIFKDQSSINIAATNLGEKDKLTSLQQFHDIIKSHNVPQIINKGHFTDLVKGLGQEYIEKYEKIFSE